MKLNLPKENWKHIITFLFCGLIPKMEEQNNKINHKTEGGNAEHN